MRAFRPPTVLLLALLLPAGTALADQPASATAIPDLEQIMADPDWIGPAVESPYWSLDGRSVLFQLKREGSPLRDRFRIDLGSGEQSAVADSELATLDAARPVYDAGHQRAAFVRNGDLFIRSLDSGSLRQLTRSSDAESSPRFSPDGRWLNYQVANDWFRIDLQSGISQPAALLKLEKDPADAPEGDALRDHQLRLFRVLANDRANREAQRERAAAERDADASRAPAPFYLGDKISISGSALSPDGRWLLLVTRDKGHDEGQGGKMPKYVTESGYNEIEDVRTRVGRKFPQGEQLLLLDLEKHEQHALGQDSLPGIDKDPLAELRKAAGKETLSGNRATQVAGIEWNDAGSHVAIMLRAVDNKDRWIAGVDFEKAALTTLHRLTDPGWINWSFNDFGWMPGSNALWYLSEEDGNSAFYTLDTAARSAKAKRRIRGDFEVSSPQPSADGRSLFFIANQPDDRGDYELYRFDNDSGNVSRLTNLDGVESFALSPGGKQLLVSYSGSYLPSQIAVVPAAGGETRRLTDTRSDAYKAIDWQQPRFVKVPSSHFEGSIPAKLYLPAMEEGKNYPVVMFVHGAGYTQNVHHRFPYYFREQMFHNLLTQEGFIVLDMDFRASAGYGRDWRTAIYRQMGHPELEDYLDGIAWLVANHQADRGRVGIYGGSYGGFMSLIALFRAPDAFQAGAALRPVTDWTAYNHEYTSNILNTPEIDPEAYRKSSPIEFAEGLKGRLLIAHGMLDNNVFYQDSVRLAQKLIELHKGGWELASYPMERHSFVHADSWYDEYRRIHELMRDTLQP
ncbi:MAG: prolyl oligopeptidase family serine peptidase [Lysobacteraceae bacterium]